MSFLNDVRLCSAARPCITVPTAPTDSTRAAVNSGAASSLVPRFMGVSSGWVAVAAGGSSLVDAAADHGVVELLAVHALGLDLLGHRVGELVVLPEGALALREFDTLLHEGLAVHVLEVDQ